MLGNISLQSLNKIRAISSAGSEHLVYTEGVGSSNLSSPTKPKVHHESVGLFFVLHHGACSRSIYNLIRASFGLRIQKSISESLAISLNNAISFGVSNLPKTRPYSSLRSISCQVGLVYFIKK